MFDDRFAADEYEGYLVDSCDCVVTLAKNGNPLIFKGKYQIKSELIQLSNE